MNEKVRKIFIDNGLVRDSNSILDPLRVSMLSLSNEEHFLKGCTGIISEMMDHIENQQKEIEKYKSILAQIRKELGIDKYEVGLFYTDEKDEELKVSNEQK